MRHLEERIADLEGEIVELHSLIRSLIKTATVDEYDAEKDQVLATDDMEGDDDNGKPETAPIRVMGKSGKVSRRSTLSKGEQVLIISPNGQFGETSLAIPLGHSEASPSPSNAEDEDITIVGSTTQRLSAGSASLTSGRVDLGANGGPAVSRIGDQVLVSVGSSAGLWPIVTGASNTFAS